MHDFMRAIGFSKLKDKREYEQMLHNVLEEPTEVFMSQECIKSAFGGMAKEYADHMGVMAFGEFTAEAELEAEYHFPYLKGRKVTMEEYLTVEKQADKVSYMGICDDINQGVAVIFQLLNMKDYMEYSIRHEKIYSKMPVTLSGLSVSGKIILPLKKSERGQAEESHSKLLRNHLISAARQGDEDAIEALTLDDMDLYATMSRRAKQEDVLSIVESYFMPYGIACDQYSVMGHILALDTLVNQVTGEQVYRMTLDCKDLVLDICINCADLLGEPMVGRRFRGNIWLQGIVDFSEKGL